MSNDDKLKVRPTKFKKKAFKELTIIRDTIFWIDVVGEGQNENAIFARPFNEKEAFPQKLTSKKYNIKNNFHGYGGKSYKCTYLKNNFYLIWIDQITNAVWFQIFKEVALNYRSQKRYLDSVQEPRQLSKSIDGNFDSSFVISQKNFLYGICEIKNRDYLFSLNLKKTKQDIYRIKKFKNFAGELSSNNSVSSLSWVEWDSLYMPWEKNDLCFAQIDLDGEITKIKKFSDKLINAKKNVSFFQPYWISETLLVCSEDSSGWWNLLFLDVSEIENIFIKKRVERNLTEYGAPQWVSGITFFSGTKKNLFCLAKKENNLIVEQYKDLQFVKEFPTPFTSISDFSVFRKKVLLKGCGSDFLGIVFEIDFAKKVLYENLLNIIPEGFNLKLEIIFPNGKFLAERTSNKSFGIVDGLSIIGTSAETYSSASPDQLEEAKAKLAKLIQNDFKGKVIFVIGENGLNLAKNCNLKFPIIKIGNWLGPLIVDAAIKKVNTIILFGYHGKLIKLAGGIFHTHNHLADARIEILVYLAVQEKVPPEIIV